MGKRIGRNGLAVYLGKRTVTAWLGRFSIIIGSGWKRTMPFPNHGRGYFYLAVLNRI